MARRRLVALLLTLLATSTACGREGSQRAAAPTASPGLPPDLPPLFVGSGRFVGGRFIRGVFLQGEQRRQFADFAGGVIVNRHEPEGDSLVRVVRGRVTPLATPPGSETSTELMDTAVIDGVPSMLYATCVRRPDAEPHGEVIVQAIETGQRRVIAQACGPEYEVVHASLGGALIAVSAYSDLTEVFHFFRLDGSEVKVKNNPTDTLPYNSAPLLADAVLSPDGQRFAYLEGPDTSGESPERPVGRWVLVVRDVSTGQDRLRVEIDNGQHDVTWLDYDGRWAIASIQFRTGGRYLPAIAVDTTSPSPRPIKLNGVSGIATIDDA